LPTYCEAVNIEKLIDEIQNLELNVAFQLLVIQVPTTHQTSCECCRRDTKIFYFLCDLKSWVLEH